MGGKTAPTANGYVISISLAGRISRGSREKVSIVKKNLIDFPWNQDPVKKNRIIIDVSRPRKTTALVSTTIYLGNLSPPFRHRYNNNTGEFIPFFVERNPPRYFNLLSSTSYSISARRHDTFAARRHLETFTHLRIPPRFYFIINDPCRWDRLGSNRFHAQAPSANVRLERNSVEVNSGGSLVRSWGEGIGLELDSTPSTYSMENFLLPFYEHSHEQPPLIVFAKKLSGEMSVGR